MKNTGIGIKRIGAALLAALMLAGCSGTNPETPEGDKAESPSPAQAEVQITEEIEAETEYDPFAELPSDTYGGRSFHLLAREAYLYELWTEEMTGDVFNDAVFERNAAVEQRYDAKIEAIPIAGEWGDRDKFLATVRSAVQAGDGAYDLIDGYAATIGNGFSDGLYLNLREVPNLRLEKGWWSELLRDELTVHGKLFAITGDIAVNVWEQMQVIFFKNTLEESTTFYLLIITNFKTDLLMSRLLSEPTSREFLLIGAADKDTAFTVLRASASMKSDAASAGNLSNDGKEPLELRRLRHAYSVY